MSTERNITDVLGSTRSGSLYRLMKWFAWGLLIVVLYVASMGPFTVLYQLEIVGDRSWGTIYWPIHRICRASPTAMRAAVWYVGLWSGPLQRAGRKP